MSLTVPASTDPFSNKPFLRSFLTGIIDYAQWPASPSKVQLCVAGNSALLHDLQSFPLASQHGMVAIKAITDADQANAAQDCSVLYIGQETPEATAANWVLTLNSKPIVTIRENPPRCSGGPLICLYTSGEKTPTFDVNLDSVARSGVLLNPMVLTLGSTWPYDLSSH